MQNFVSPSLALLLLFSITNVSNAGSPSMVFCEAGTWPGSAVIVENGEFHTENLPVTLPTIIYDFDKSSNEGYITIGKNKIKSIILRRERSTKNNTNFIVVYYYNNNIHSTDTLYETGMVFAQYSKISIDQEPLASTLYKQCKVLR